MENQRHIASYTLLYSKNGRGGEKIPATED